MSYIRTIFISGVLLIASLVFSCGGGGGGTASQPPPSQPPPSQPTTQSVKVSGNVGLGLSRIVGASATKTQITNLPPARDASVEITAYDRNGNQTDKRVLKTTEIGSFGTTLTLSNNGGYVLIDIKKEGFTDFSKRVDFERPSDINIQAVLNELLVAVAQVREENFVLSSSTGEKVITFAVFETKTGQKVIKTGRDVNILKQNGSQPVLQIEIPAQPIQQLGIQTLVARLQSFDPIRDADSFPGQYRDSEGYQLVSLGFDYINIQDETGKNIGEVVRQAIAQGRISKSQAGQTRISRWIGGNSCGSLLKDFCGQGQDHPLCGELTPEENNGFNVPVYTYNPIKGLWEMLGIGTIDKDGNGRIDGGDVINSLDDAKNLCNSNNGLLLQILVSNEDFLKYWWNLDYPLIDEPKEVCATLTFKTSSGEPVSGLWVYFKDEDEIQSFSPDWQVSDTQGKITFRRTVFGTVDTEAQISFYNPFTWEDQTQTITLRESPNCYEQEITIQKPQCKVEGVVRDEEGSTIGNVYVYAYTMNPYHYNYSYTNNNGYFSIDVKCNLEYELYVSYTGEKKSFKVDGITSGDEEQDNGEKVRLKDIIILNQAPNIGGWLSTTSIKAGQSIFTYFYGWDQECNTPISWEILVDDQPTLSGQSQACWFSEWKEIPSLAGGTHTIKLKARDSQGKSSIVELGQVTVQDNRAPVIVYATPERVFVPPNSPVKFYGYAYDLDGDSLTYKWYADNVEISNCHNNTVCQYTTPPIPTGEERPIEIKFEVSDGQSTVSETFIIKVVSNRLDIIIQKNNSIRR